MTTKAKKVRAARHAKVKKAAGKHAKAAQRHVKSKGHK